MSETLKTGPQVPELPERGRSKRVTNSESPQGWALTTDRLIDRLFAPSFLAFVLVLFLAYFALGNAAQDVDRLIKVLAVVAPLVSAYAGYAFGKTR